MNAQEVRALCRAGRLEGPTAGLAPGHVQANLVCLPAAHAEDFLTFCKRNPGPCPLLEVLEPGGVEPLRAAPGADLRTDLPRYRVYAEGRLVAEPRDLRSHWRPDLVSFLLGCSFTFDRALREAGLPVRHEEEGRNVPMYVTSLPCQAAGPFQGPLVVSMRPMSPEQARRAADITARFPLAHGAPVHVGDPGRIGIRDLGKPDHGEAVSVHPGEVPVFWACGVTPQSVAVASRIPFLITHCPGHMLVTDWMDTDLQADSALG
jgi:uncharacterized protein YcsI (UPF0317 family)